MTYPPPYWGYYPPPGAQPPAPPTIEDLKAHRKMLDDLEKDILEKDKSKKAKDKKGPQASKFEVALLMWLFSPIIGFATLKFYILMGQSLQAMILSAH